MKQLTFDSKLKFESFLKDNGINVSKYGVGKAKSVQNLYDELENGDAILYISDESNKVIREVRVLSLNILYEDFVLKETKQIFKKDGVETDRFRERNLDTSMGEKIMPNEDLKEATLRAMKEELGIELNEYQLDLLDFKTKEIVDESPSFPGITTKYTFLIDTILLESEQYKEEGYIEEQEDKNVYFGWKKNNFGEY